MSHIINYMDDLHSKKSNSSINSLFCRRCRHSKYRWYIWYFKFRPFGKIWSRIDAVGDRWCYKVGGNGKKVREKTIHWKSFPKWSRYSHRKSKQFQYVKIKEGWQPDIFLKDCYSLKESWKKWRTSLFQRKD